MTHHAINSLVINAQFVVGIALAKSGIKTTNIVRKQRHCWHHKDSEGHILAAVELANGLNDFSITGVQKSIELTPENFKSKIAGKTGIISYCWWLGFK